MRRWRTTSDACSSSAVAPHPRGDVFYRGSRLADKVRKAVERSSDLDLLFVHRDADNAGAEARFREIEAGVGDALPNGSRHVAVVPVKMTESWLLLDETAIRKIVGKPKGKQPLGLPPVAKVEATSDPKEVLRNAFLAAIATKGRRRRKFKREFPRLRRSLLEDLPVGGHLASLPSWVAFRSAVQAVLAELAYVEDRGDICRAETTMPIAGGSLELGRPRQLSPPR